MGEEFARDTIAASGSAPSLVSVLMVTYNPDEGSLRRCLASVRGQTYGNLELILVDNGSSGRAGARLQETVQAGPGGSLPTKVHRLGANTGFAHAMNVAVQAASGALCLLLNPDTELEPTVVESLVACAGAYPDVAGFAPKVKLLAYPDIIDSVGIEFSWSGDAAQRGLGQIDLGQFDAPEAIMGVTMCATLIRRTAFEDDQVGPLDERFFMFFEDVDWSLRASLYGKHFLAVADAVVFHAGSESVRKKPYTWRYRLIERNVYYTAIKNFESRHLVGFLLRRTRSHLRKLASGVRPLTTARVLLEAIAALAWVLPERRAVQGRRQRRDADLTNAEPTTPAIDRERWCPVYSWETVRDSVGRLCAVSGEERWSRAYRYLDLLLEFDLKLDSSEVVRRLEEMAGPLPSALQAYVAKIGSTRG